MNPETVTTPPTLSPSATAVSDLPTAINPAEAAITNTAAPTAQPSGLLHFKPQAGIAGDCHPFFYEGTCYLYYLDEKFNSILVTSPDMLHWTPQTITHTPPGGDYPFSLPYFVLGVWYDEQAGLFRSYHGGPNNMMVPEVSKDLLNWDYAPKSMVAWSQARYSQQRDPYVFWNEDEQKYWMVMTCLVAGESNLKNGAICYASSADLTNWEARGDLIYPGSNAAMECPQMFKLDGRWYLFASVSAGHVGKLSYWVSEQPTGPWKQMVPPSVDGDNLEAPNMGFDGEHWVMFGWIPLLTGPAGGSWIWGGHVGFPRQLFRLADGSLGARLEPKVSRAIRGQEIGTLAAAEVKPSTGKWQNEGSAWILAQDYGVADLGVETARFDADLSFALPLDGGYAGFRIAGRDNKDKVEIVVDHNRGVISVRHEYKEGEGSDYASIELAEKEPVYNMRVILEENMVEVFVNDRYTLAARIPERLPVRRIGLAGKGENIRFSGASIYWLKFLEEIA
jgi:sucrose-6-phosphate hydrolase SacC (GH32 family)